MSVDPHTLLDAAKRLAEGEREVDQRNATSRAYYAAYHLCVAIAEELPPPARTSGVHRTLIDQLTAGNNRLKSIGYMLEDCFRARILADYDIKTSFMPKSTKTTLEHCAKIFEMASGLPP